MEIVITRKADNGVNTKGELYIHKTGFKCDTLELAWKNNERGVSCIPLGVYGAVRHVSPKFGECLLLVNTAPRQQILIHSANYASSVEEFRSQLRGCIALGRGYGDLNKDGVCEILNSRDTVQRFMQSVRGNNVFRIFIKEQKV